MPGCEWGLKNTKKKKDANVYLLMFCLSHLFPFHSGRQAEAYAGSLFSELFLERLYTCVTRFE